MSFDSPQTPERLITVEEVIKLFSGLRQGRGDREAVIATYIKWCEQEEAAVTNPLAQIEFEIRKAELLISAGCIPEAWDIAKDIYDTAGTELEEDPEREEDSKIKQRLKQRLAAMALVFDATPRD